MKLTLVGGGSGAGGAALMVAHPAPKQNIVADINMDMFLTLESTLGDDIRDICQKAGVAVQADKEPNRNVFIRIAGAGVQVRIPGRIARGDDGGAV